MMNRRRRQRRGCPGYHGKAYVGSMHFWVNGPGMFGLSFDPPKKEARVQCPVCKARLERIPGTGVVCASCGFTESERNG